MPACFASLISKAFSVSTFRFLQSWHAVFTFMLSFYLDSQFPSRHFFLRAHLPLLQLNSEDFNSKNHFLIAHFCSFNHLVSLIHFVFSVNQKGSIVLGPISFFQTCL